MSIEELRIFTEGWSAAMEGLDPEDNPYPMMSDKYIRWLYAFKIGISLRVVIGK